MFKIDFITLIAILGAFNGLLFAVLIWLNKKDLSNRLFSLLLFVTSIRIAKNIVVHTQELNDGMIFSYPVWRFLINFGISHQFAIGPMFYFYFLSRADENFRLKPVYFLHFIPYLILTLMSPYIPWIFWKTIGLWLSYISILVYYLLSFRVYFFTSQNGIFQEGTKKWLKSILIIVAVLLVAYCPALFKYLGYTGGAVLYTCGVVFVMFTVFVERKYYSYHHTKYKSTTISQSQSEDIKTRLSNCMESKKVYLDPELTLKKLAQQLEIKPHQLSQVINDKFQQSFSDFVNGYRLEEAKRKLKNPKLNHLKIAAIAYESGFNSLATFNTLFKKKEKITPSEFRKMVNHS